MALIHQNYTNYMKITELTLYLNKPDVYFKQMA